MKRNVLLVAAVAAGVVAVVTAVVVLLRWEPVPPAATEWPEPPSPDPAPPAVAEPAPPETAPAPPPIEQTPAIPDDETQPPITLPPLAESDPFVRAQLGPELGLPLADWLKQTDLLARIAALLLSGSQGEIPKRLIDYSLVPEKFAVEETGGITMIAPESYARFDALVDSATAIPAASGAELFILVEPLLAEALAEYGSNALPRDLLMATLGHVLRTPVVETLAVEQTDVFYEYANPALERQLPLQKQLLRMGPDNVRALKAYARELRMHLAGR